MSEFTVAKILKQLVLILEKNDFVLYYDKRFPSMKPHINDSTPYLYHNSLGHMHQPCLQFRFHDKDKQIDYAIRYDKNFPRSLKYDKTPYPNQIPVYMRLPTSLNPCQTYSEDEAKELAMKWYQNLMKKPVENTIKSDSTFIDHYEAVHLTTV